MLPDNAMAVVMVQSGFVPMRKAAAGRPPPNAPTAAPAYGRHSPLEEERRADGDGCGTAVGHAGADVTGRCDRGGDGVG